jgi:hypothetical protein
MSARATESNLSKGTQRKVDAGVRSAYFRNTYRHPKSGELGPLTSGIVNFKPGEIRFVTAQAQMRSGNGFAKGVELGWLAGPAETAKELEIDLDLEESPDTVARIPELPDDNDDVSAATDESMLGVETVPVGGEDEEPAPTAPPPAEDPPASVEMPQDDEDPPASVDNDPTPAEPEPEPVKAAEPEPEPISADAEEEVTEPKAPSAKDLIAGARKSSKKSKKGSSKKG